MKWRKVVAYSAVIVSLAVLSSYYQETEAEGVSHDEPPRALFNWND